MLGELFLVTERVVAPGAAAPPRHWLRVCGRSVLVLEFELVLTVGNCCPGAANFE